MSLACLVAEHTVAHMDLAIASGADPGITLSVIRSFFYGPPGRPESLFPTSSIEERIAMLEIVAPRGVDFMRPPSAPGSYEYRAPAVECATRHRKAITDAAAIRLPVEGVPEMVTKYAGTPYDYIIQYKLTA